MNIYKCNIIYPVGCIHIVLQFWICNFQMYFLLHLKSPNDNKQDSFWMVKEKLNLQSQNWWKHLVVSILNNIFSLLSCSSLVHFYCCGIDYPCSPMRQNSDNWHLLFKQDAQHSTTEQQLLWSIQILQVGPFEDLTGKAPAMHI